MATRFNAGLAHCHAFFISRPGRRFRRAGEGLVVATGDGVTSARPRAIGGCFGHAARPYSGHRRAIGNHDVAFQRRLSQPPMLVYHDRMGRLTVKQIEELARSIIASEPGGIRFTALREKILHQGPETNLHYQRCNLEPPREIRKRHNQAKPWPLQACRKNRERSGDF
jgi:hypothetical protein